VAAGQIALIDRARGDTLRYARAGDTVRVDVLVNSGRGRPLTGVEFYLRFDPAFLTPVDADTSAPGLQPVRSEGLIRRAEGITNVFNVSDPARYRGIPCCRAARQRTRVVPRPWPSGCFRPSRRAGT
jgi:hypothetical protein